MYARTYNIDVHTMTTGRSALGRYCAQFYYIYYCVPYTLTYFLVQINNTQYFHCQGKIFYLFFLLFINVSITHKGRRDVNRNSV